MKSTEFLQAAIDIQAERGKQYDSLEGERSMGRTVKAFNAITGRELSEPEGWLLLQILKDVRQWQNPGAYHHDSALDGVAYAALKAEALSGDGANAKTPQDLMSSSELAPSSEFDRCDLILTPQAKWDYDALRDCLSNSKIYAFREGKILMITARRGGGGQDWMSAEFAANFVTPTRANGLA